MISKFYGSELSHPVPEKGDISNCKELVLQSSQGPVPDQVVIITGPNPYQLRSIINYVMNMGIPFECHKRNANV